MSLSASFFASASLPNVFVFDCPPVPLLPNTTVCDVPSCLIAQNFSSISKRRNTFAPAVDAVVVVAAVVVVCGAVGAGFAIVGSFDVGGAVGSFLSIAT